jgi:quinoprotein dehydrogenase-associated probable ABC transporter substrate-binding protein
MNKCVIIGATVSAVVGLLCVLAAPSTMAAPEQTQPRTAFKVCADPNAMPSSNEQEQGFENRIAKLFADDLGLPLQYTWFPKRLGFYRQTLKNDKTPDGSYKCDVYLHEAYGADMVALTRPYYHSSWAMVYVKGRGLDDVDSQEALANLPEARKKSLRIGLFDRGPATDWAFKHGLIDYMVAYSGMDADLATYPGKIIEEDLVDDKINVTFVWGPVAGWTAKKLKEEKGVEIAVIPMKSEEGIRFDYKFAMATRHGEKEWTKQIDSLIAKHADQIRAILADYNIPTLSDPLSEPYVSDKDDDDDDGDKRARDEGSEKTENE